MRVPVAKQTRLVSVEGEVGAPGVYQLLPGETLQQLIARAGGFSPQAYVYGLEFTREETRARQRENLAAAMARLEALEGRLGAGGSVASAPQSTPAPVYQPAPQPVQPTPASYGPPLPPPVMMSPPPVPPSLHAHV